MIIWSFIILLDCFKIKKKINYSWKFAYENNLIYSFYDLFNDIKNKSWTECVTFLILLKIIKTIVIIQIIVIILSLPFNTIPYDGKNANLPILILIVLPIKTANNLKKNFKWSALINKNLIFNIIFILIWDYSRFVINHTVICNKIWYNCIFLNPNKKKVQKFLQSIKRVYSSGI